MKRRSFLSCASGILFLASAMLISCARTGGAGSRFGAERAASQATVSWLSEQYGFLPRESSVYPEQIASRLIQQVGSAGGLCRHYLRFEADRSTPLSAALETLSPRGRSTGARHHSSPSSSGGVSRFQVLVLRDDTPNAFSVGASTIVLSRGLILALESEAELAAVIAHEMSHELLGHVAKGIVEVSDNEPAPGQSLHSRPAQDRSIRTQSSPGPLSRLAPDDERDADRFGLCLLEASQFPLDAAVTSLTKGYRREGAAVASNHQLTERIVALEESIQRLPGRRPPPAPARGFFRFRRLIAEPAPGER